MTDVVSNNYVVGKGRLYFDKFLDGTKTTTGERYFGNTPTLTNSTAISNLDHYDADQGMKVKDESIAISNDLTGAFSTDNINSENVALFFCGDTDQMVVTSATAVIDPNTPTISPGRYYQIGVSLDTPQGVRNVTNVKISKQIPPVLPATVPTWEPIVLANNVDVDLDRAKVYIESDAPDLVDGDILQFTYDQEASTRNLIIGKSDVIAGTLRFEAANPQGDNRDYFWPYVKITPDGDYALKGDDWQVLGFKFEVLKRDSATERVYIDGVGTAS